MTIYKTNEKLNLDTADGIWLDYKDHHWLFFIKDRVWDAEELQRVNHSDIVVDFVQKGIVDAFLLEIYDCLETSDIPFCMKDAEGEVLDSLHDSAEYYYEIVILNEENVVLADRELPMGHRETLVLKDKLQQRLSQDYDSQAFDNAYHTLMMRYEPYELEQFTIFTNRKQDK